MRCGLRKRAKSANALSVVIADDSIAEGDGAAASSATVTRSGSTTGDILVTLSSDDTSEATVPGTVTILDGQASAVFDIAAVDDLNVDGSQTVTLTAAATGYVGGTDSVIVTDDETASVVIIDDGDDDFSQSGFDYLANPSLTGYETDWHRKAGGNWRWRGELDILRTGRWPIPGEHHLA